jgi:hypothetical protein
MNSVLLGVDFISTDDEILLLEMNTDIGLSRTKSPFFDFEPIFNYILTNNFTTLRLIYKTQLVDVVFIDTFRNFCTTNNIDFIELVIPTNGVTIPSYDDDETTLNIRLSYNAQAILDDMYCRDKNELISLLFENGEEEIIPKTHTIHNGSVLDSLTGVGNNGEIPNLIIKKQLPDFKKDVYPIFLKTTTPEELETVKSTIPNGTLIQEYKFSPNSIEDGLITTHIRQWVLVTNQLSEIIECGGYLHSNQIPLNENIIEYTDNKLNNMSRYMFFSNPLRVTDEGIPSTYKIEVQQTDGEFLEIEASSVQVGDVIKAIHIDTFEYDFNRQQTKDWQYTGNTDSLITNTTAQVVSIIHKSVEDWFIRVTYTDGINVGSSLLPHSKLILLERDGVVKFDSVTGLDIGDELFNSPGIKSTITSIENEYFVGTMSIIDIEPSDVFIAGTNNNEILDSLVLHNYQLVTK